MGLAICRSIVSAHHGSLDRGQQCRRRRDVLRDPAGGRSRDARAPQPRPSSSSTTTPPCCKAALAAAARRRLAGRDVRVCRGLSRRAERRADGCLVLDVTMPGLDGLGLQRRLADVGHRCPIVFLTGHGDIPMSVQAIKAGAVDFLTKPVKAEVLLPAVRAAIEQDASTRRARADAAELASDFASLTSREREVLAAWRRASSTSRSPATSASSSRPSSSIARASWSACRRELAAELMLIAAKLGLGDEGRRLNQGLVPLRRAGIA